MKEHAWALYLELIRKADPDKIDPDYLATCAFHCAESFLRESKKHADCDH